MGWPARTLMKECAEPVLHFPMSRAAICCSCDSVFRVAPTCPACASESVELIGRWLDRKEGA